MCEQAASIAISAQPILTRSEMQNAWCLLKAEPKRATTLRPTKEKVATFQRRVLVPCTLTGSEISAKIDQILLERLQKTTL